VGGSEYRIGENLEESVCCVIDMNAGILVKGPRGKTWKSSVRLFWRGHIFEPGTSGTRRGVIHTGQRRPSVCYVFSSRAWSSLLFLPTLVSLSVHGYACRMRFVLIFSFWGHHTGEIVWCTRRRSSRQRQQIVWRCISLRHCSYELAKFWNARRCMCARYIAGTYRVAF
jgi:hypothetical protein